MNNFSEKKLDNSVLLSKGVTEKKEIVKSTCFPYCTENQHLRWLVKHRIKCPCSYHPWYPWTLTSSLDRLVAEVLRDLCNLSGTMATAPLAWQLLPLANGTDSSSLVLSSKMAVSCRNEEPNFYKIRILVRFNKFWHLMVNYNKRLFNFFHTKQSVKYNWTNAIIAGSIIFFTLFLQWSNRLNIFLTTTV